MKLLLALALMTSPIALAAQTSAQNPAPAPSTAPADQPGVTAAGVSFTQPRDWTATTSGPVVVFTAPEGDLNLALVDAGQAADAQAAAAHAWSLYRVEARRNVRLTTPAAPSEGWEERVAFAYETSPNERASVSAMAMRRGGNWTVLIVDGAEATLGKRLAAASVVQQSLRPAGYERESFAGRTAHRLTPERIELLRRFVAESAETLGVPGVGLAFLDNNQVVWEGGVGVRELGSNEPVTEDTKFMVASNTKGMATLLLSVLADEGRLRWDQPVTELYPAFRLGDDATTRSVLVRHLVCACTGLPRKDFAFILAAPGAPASDTFTQLAVTQPTSGFGELFQYNNLMASAAGYLGGMLSYPDMEIGAAFDRAMEEKIFGPLDMDDTTFDFEQGMRGNWARPHGLDVDGRLVEIPNDFNYVVYPHRPAGGVWSTAADMAHYVQLELTRGIGPDGRRVVSEENILKRRERGVPVGEDSWYGMGLFERVAWGVPVVTHGGTLLGYHSNFYVLPEAGIGAVILTNADPGAAMLAPFLRRLLEVVYDGKPEAEQEVTAAAARIKAQAKARRDRLTVPGDPAVLARLAATYRNPEVGTLSLTDRDGTKWLKAGFVEGPVATRKNPDGSISLVSAGPGAISLEALVGEANGTRTLTIRDSQHEYVYTEVR